MPGQGMNILKSKKGASMVSVLVAFVMLLILLGGFITVIVSSGKILSEAERTERALGAATESFWSEFDRTDCGEVEKLFFVGEGEQEKAAFTLSGSLKNADFFDYYLHSPFWNKEDEDEE